MHADADAGLQNSVTGDYDVFVLASTEEPGSHEGIPIAIMEAMAAGLPVVSTYTGSIDILLKDGLDTLFQLNRIYEKGSIDVKRQVIGSIYPEKLSFNGEHLRTTRINEAVRIIYAMGKDLPGNEKGQSGNFSALSSQVGVTGLSFG